MAVIKSKDVRAAKTQPLENKTAKRKKKLKPHNPKNPITQKPQNRKTP